MFYIIIYSHLLIDYYIYLFQSPAHSSPIENKFILNSKSDGSNVQNNNQPPIPNTEFKLDSGGFSYIEPVSYSQQYPNQNIINAEGSTKPSSNKQLTNRAKRISPLKQSSPHKNTVKSGKQGEDDNAFSIQQWRQWKGKYTAKDSNGCHCLVCPGKSYSTERALLRHYKQVHELICAQCRICFSEEHLLKQHRKENHEFWCFPCSKVYTTSRALRRHNQQQHGISQSTSVSQSQLQMNHYQHTVEHYKTSEVSHSFYLPFMLLIPAVISVTIIC